MLEGSVSTNELPVGPLDFGKIVTTCGNGKPISTQAKVTARNAELFVITAEIEGWQ